MEQKLKGKIVPPWEVDYRKVLAAPSINHPERKGWKMTPDRITKVGEYGSWKKGKDLEPDKDFWEK